MIHSKSFLLKIVYLATIGILLIPLSMISRPNTRDKYGNIANPGGKLSQLRVTHNLAQAQLSKIDPASETMKLASLGLRGVAVNILWMQAMEHKKNENYDQLASTLKALTKIQPSFVKVWEFQAHNLAYNVSMEFDDYEYRYHWVKKGLSFLKEGVPYNKTDHRMTDNLGFYTGNKMGKSDERVSFRRLFRIDDEFHADMSDMIEPDSYDTRDYGHDSWMMAYQWYDHSRRLVELLNSRPIISDVLFYMYRPSQRRNQGMSLQEEFRTDEIIQDIWRISFEEWLEYGQQPISNSRGAIITLEGLTQYEKDLQRYRDELDEFAPGVRDQLIGELTDLGNLTEEEVFAMKLPYDQRDAEQLRLAREADKKIKKVDSNLDQRVVDKVASTDQVEAKRILGEIARVRLQMISLDRDSGTSNFSFWKARTAAEANDLTVLARQLMFDAEEMERKSIYDDEIDRDYVTKQTEVTRKGAITLYLESFEKWEEVLELYPRLKTGSFADDLARTMLEFQEILSITSRDWPADFPLQELIDTRAKENNGDGLPTTEDLEEQRSAWEDGEDSDEAGSTESE